MKIAVEEWELYNNGILLCKWFDLEDVELETIEAYVRNVKKEHNLNCDDLELFVADVEDDELNIIKGDESLNYAYEIQEHINNIEECDLPKIAFLTDIQGYSIEDAIEKVEDCEYYEDMTMEELAEEFINEGLFGEIPEKLTRYIDYEAVARDIALDYTEYNGDIFRCN